MSYIVPLESETATTFAPHSSKNFMANVPTFPKPSMATVMPFRSLPMCLTATLVDIATPKPVEPSSCGSPPTPAGFPVHAFGVPSSSANWAISLSVTFMSGPAMYSLGTTSAIFRANALICSSFWRGVSFLASAFMPLLAPPNGRSAIAFFQVMALARPITSSFVTSGTILIPPFPGPRAVLCMTQMPCMPVLWSYTSTIFSNPNSSSLFIWINLVD